MKVTKEINKLINRSMLFLLGITLIILFFFREFSFHFLGLICLLLFTIFILNISGKIRIYRNDPYYNELKRRKDYFFEVIDNFDEPILIFDRSGIIRAFNRCFYRLVNIENMRKKEFENIDLPGELKIFLRKTVNFENIEKTEIFINQKSYILTGRYNKNIDQFYIVFHDITQKNELERLKKEFLQNMAHELRTPLTSISGFTHTLLEDEKSEHKVRFLNIIKRNSERMKEIVNDLMEISSLESNPIPENVYFYVRDVSDKVVDMLREKCEKKGIVLNYNVDEDFEIFFDSFNFEQILVNLLDNAIKYTEMGSITLKIRQENSKFNILVRDTGIGISKENIPRIFERFFVVSKSRSRSRGGTGLGLAIVKHIVKIHNGDIEVKSQLGSGSEFLLVFSKKL